MNRRVFYDKTDKTMHVKVGSDGWIYLAERGRILRVKDTNGEIFAVDNDPGSCPPCRLLNIIEGADYGYQWVYGRAPVHPFVGWNGELRGTLPMIHPSAPTWN